jgi:hypothetical protein
VLKILSICPIVSLLIALLETLQGEKTNVRFSSDLGVSRYSLINWKAGQETIRDKGVEKIAAYIGTDAKQVRRYLEQEIDLNTLLNGTPFEQRRSRNLSPIRFELVIEALNFFSLRQLALIAEKIAQIFVDRTGSKSIQHLIELELEKSPWREAEDSLAAFAEEVDLEVAELDEILNGQRPSAAQLVALSVGLRKDDGSRWTIDELRGMVHRQYGHPSPKPNGV